MKILYGTIAQLCIACKKVINRMHCTKELPIFEVNVCKPNGTKEC